ncbi:MAG: cupin [Longimicrobiales bacterium]
MKTELDRPTRPDPLEAGAAPAFDLAALADELLDEAAAGRSGRSAVTLVAHAGLTVLLTALRKGGTLDEHRARGPVAVTCVKGRVTFGLEGGEEDLPTGCTIAFPPDALHSVRAAEDSAILIILGSSP